MSTQTTLRIENNHIIGLYIHNRKIKWKQCKWCNHTFLPEHNKQAYCDATCRSVARQTYTSRWIYHRRKQEQNGDYINDKNVLNIGTGGLGQHRASTDEEEYKKIQGELKRIGIKGWGKW